MLLLSDLWLKARYFTKSSNAPILT
uniref:Uncharacterized protein n=1 Tax=Macrostomum lignano TaxID=282301 RepID=A0A1I8FE78_9PLAT